MSFTKPTGTPVLGFVSAVTRVPATWFNYVSNNFTSIVDGVGGGYYELAGADLEISSDTKGIVINTASASFPTELRGYVLVGLSDDPGYPTGVGTFTVQSPATFSSSVTFSGAIVYNNTITFNNIVTFASGADPVVQSGCAWTWQSGSSATFANGSTLTANGLVSINATTGSSITLASGGTFTNNSPTVLNGTVTIDNAQSVVFDSAKTYERTIDHLPAYDAAHWAEFVSGSVVPIHASQTISAGTTQIAWAFRVPTGGTVTAASIFITPPTGHGGVPVVTVSVAKLLRSGVGAADLHTQSDTSPDVATYETPHELAVSGFTLTFNEGELLIVRITPETGANALVNMKVSPPKVTFTRTTLGEE